jgi:hypothetical protein
MEISWVFNSVESGIVLFTDRNSIIDFSSRQMKPISSLGMDLVSNPNDVSFFKEANDNTQKNSKGDVSFSLKQPIIKKMNSITNIGSNIEASCFIDILGKHQLVFMEDNKISVA